MKPIDYIYKNLDSFNISIFKQIVEESGEEVSESIYDYLMKTTWNTNPALLKQFGLDIERSSEDESNEWTTITLKKTELTRMDEGELETYYTVGTNKPDDLAKIQELKKLVDANEHPIVRVDYNIKYESENHTVNNMIASAINVPDSFIINGFSDMGLSIYDYNNERGYGESLFSEARWGEDISENEYIIIRYKTGNHYSVSIDEFPIFVEPNSSWILQDISPQQYYSDGTNKYYNGDTIYFVDGMTLTQGYDD